MKKCFSLTSLIISVLLITLVVSCGKKNDQEEETYPDPVSWSPEPVNGHLPTSVLPAALVDTVSQFIEIHSGDTPAEVWGQFLSQPHVLIFSTVSTDIIGKEFDPRYICFQRNGERVNFVGKQGDYEESYYKLNVVGTGENFTCYYITEGYPNGMYAKQATIFSGKWTENLGGLGDFKVAVVLLVTSGNPNLEPVNTFRVLGDADGLAENNPWLGGKRADFGTEKMSNEDAFRMFRVK